MLLITLSLSSSAGWFVFRESEYLDRTQQESLRDAFIEKVAEILSTLSKERLLGKTKTPKTELAGKIYRCLINPECKESDLEVILSMKKMAIACPSSKLTGPEIIEIIKSGTGLVNYIIIQILLDNLVE